MYIRRKVFSVMEDMYGDEKLFSTTEFINEDTYLDQKLYFQSSLGETFTTKDIQAYMKKNNITSANQAKAMLGAELDEARANADELAKRSRKAAKGATREGWNWEKNKQAAEEAKANVKTLWDKSEKPYHKSDFLAANDTKAKRVAHELELRKKNSVVGKATNWVKNNPKLAAGIVAGTLVGGGASAYAANRD